MGHLALPALFARVLWPAQWLRAWAILFLANIVDVDHLLADPIYDANRCSIGFHPLHGPTAILLYCSLLLPRPTRPLAAGLLLHMAWDQIDCWWMQLLPGS